MSTIVREEMTFHTMKPCAIGRVQEHLYLRLMEIRSEVQCALDKSIYFDEQERVAFLKELHDALRTATQTVSFSICLLETEAKLKQQNEKVKEETKGE